MSYESAEGLMTIPQSYTQPEGVFLAEGLTTTIETVAGEQYQDGNTERNHHMVAWTAAKDGHDETVLHGAKVSKPSIASTIPHLAQTKSFTDSEPTSNVLKNTVCQSIPVEQNVHHSAPEGFILNGTINLFGLESLQTDFYSYSGPIPTRLIKRYGVENLEHIVPIYQMAVLSEDLRLSCVMPGFVGTSFDVLAFKNVKFAFQNMPLDLTKVVGFTLEADIIFDESYGKLHDVLTDFLGVPEPSLHLECGLPGPQDWHEPLDVSSFVLTGVFPDISLSLCEGASLTKVGARVIGYHVIRHDDEGDIHSEHDYGFGVFGNLHLLMPGSITPMDFEFDISSMAGTLTMTGELDAHWDHAFGISALTLHSICFSVDFEPKEGFSSLILELGAMLDVGETSVQIQGEYHVRSKEFYLVASFERLDFTGLNNLFEHLFDEQLVEPDVPISIGAATLEASSELGLRLHVHHVCVGEHVVSEGVFEIGTNGVLLKAQLDEGVATVGDFRVTKAYLSISFGRSSKIGSTTDVMLGGEVEWKGWTIDVGVHVYISRSSGSTNQHAFASTDNKGIEREKSLEYTVYGQFANSVTNNGLLLADLIPELKGTFMEDVRLEGAAIIIASCDNGQLGPFNKGGYSVRQGFQVCASFSGLAPLDTISRQENTPLILNAGWSPKAGFSIDIYFPSAMRLDLGRGVVTDPIHVSISLSGSSGPQLLLAGGANIPVEGSTKPLHFQLIIELHAKGASATAQLEGGWKNPFGVSNQLTLGPVLALKIEINWITFLAHGPSGFGFVGGLQIGKVNGQLAFEVSENPSQQLLYTEIPSLDLQDLACFASVVTGTSIPPPENIIEFRRVKFYVCPMGATVGNVYPRGMSFSAGLTLFGKNADINVSIGEGGVSCSGGVDDFKFGPLEVSGVTGPRACFELVLNSKRQGGKIDGRIVFCGIETKLVGMFELQPTFVITFDFELHFLDIFVFTVHATPLNPPSATKKELEDCGYWLTAEFHSTLREHISKSVNRMFDEAARKQKKESETAQATLEAEKEKWRLHIEEAECEVERTYATWSSKENLTKDNQACVEKDVASKLSELQDSLSSASASLRNEVAAARAKLAQEENDRASRLRQERENLDRVEREWHSKINDAQNEVDNLTREMCSTFGSAENDIRGARDTVNSLQDELNDLDRQIDARDREPWYDVGAKGELVGLGIARGSVWVAKETADVVLQVALAVVESSDFIACQGAMGLAKAALDIAHEGATAAIDVAKEALDGVDVATRELVDLAQEALDKVQELGQIAVDAAGAALRQYEDSAVAILAEVRDVLDALDKCLEKLAYEAALMSLKAAKAGAAAVISVAQAAAVIGHSAQHAVLKASQWIMTIWLELINVTDIELTAEFSTSVGFAFDATVRGTIDGDHFFSLEISFSLAEQISFITSLFDRLIDWITDMDVAPKEKRLRKVQHVAASAS